MVQRLSFWQETTRCHPPCDVRLELYQSRCTTRIYFWAPPFFIFINDIVTDVGCNIRLFADDTSLYIIVVDVAARCINFDLDIIFDWACKWLVKFSPPKTDSMLLSRKINKPYHPPLFMSNNQIKEVTSYHINTLVFICLVIVRDIHTLLI